MMSRKTHFSRRKATADPIAATGMPVPSSASSSAGSRVAPADTSTRQPEAVGSRPTAVGTSSTFASQPASTRFAATRASAARPVLDVRDVHRIYESGAGYTHALRGVSLTVDPGEFLCIMGPSGSGKSTLMNILGCLDTPTKGQYFLEGLDVSTLDDDDLALLRATRLGFVFQSFNLLPRSTVLRNVMLPLLYTRTPPAERMERAVRALAAVSLPVEHFEHKSNELSGGQMQRVAIARALVNDPALILADEPTGNLDSATGEMVLETFSSLRDEGKTIVLITHDPEVAAWADRIVYIRDGRLLTSEEERAVVASNAMNGREGRRSTT